MIEYGAHREFGILFFPYLMINLVTINQFTSSIVSFCGISCINQPYNINVLQPPRAEVSAIGDGDKDIRIDCYKGRLNPGMEFLLCTDGFYGLLEEEEIYQVEASKEQIKEWVQKCFQKVKRRGELDNLSCVIVKVPNKK